MDEVRVVKTWDELPPFVSNGCDVFSTRVLEKKSREMFNALEFIAKQEDKTGNWAVELAKKIIDEIGWKI